VEDEINFALAVEKKDFANDGSNLGKDTATLRRCEIFLFSARFHARGSGVINGGGRGNLSFPRSWKMIFDATDNTRFFLFLLSLPLSLSLSLSFSIAFR